VEIDSPPAGMGARILVKTPEPHHEGGLLV